jgi:hypothetical protein
LSKLYRTTLLVLSDFDKRAPGMDTVLSVCRPSMRKRDALGNLSCLVSESEIDTVS